MKSMNGLTGIQKVAIVLTTLDPDTAANLIKEFDIEQIALITAEMSKIEHVDKQYVEQVIRDLSKELRAFKTGVQYDGSTVKKLLEKAVGSQKSEEILTSIDEGAILPVPFYALRGSGEEELVRILAGEHPQTIALVLSYVDPERAAKVLCFFPTELQAEVIMRISTMDSPHLKLLLRVNEVVSAKSKGAGDRRQKTSAKKKYKAASDIIGNMEGSADKNVVDMISHRNPELADEIKKLLFTFDDIVYVNDEAFRKILTEIDNRVIALALKTANEAIEKKFFSNVSKRVGDAVREEKELLGPRLLSEVEAAQQQIVDAVKRLEAKGENVVNKKGAQGAGADKFV